MDDDPRVVALDAVQEELALLRGDVRATRASTDAKTATTRRLLFAFAVLSLVAGYSSLVSRQAINDIIATRTESRRVTCVQDNTRITRHNVLVDAVQKAVQLVNTPNPDRTSEQQATLDQFIVDYQATVEVARDPLRDCTPEGIRRFYEEG